MHNFYSNYKDEGEDDKRERERKEEKNKKIRNVSQPSFDLLIFK